MLLRQHAAVSAFVASSLNPGEGIQAILSFAEIGSSARRNLPFLASLGLVSAKSEPRACAVVVTDRRLLIVGQSRFPTLQPQSLSGDYPRAAVRVGAFSRNLFGGSLRLEIADHEALGLTVRRAWRAQAQQVAQMLGWHRRECSQHERNQHREPHGLAPQPKSSNQ